MQPNFTAAAFETETLTEADPWCHLVDIAREQPASLIVISGSPTLGFTS